MVFQVNNHNFHNNRGNIIGYLNNRRGPQTMEEYKTLKEIKYTTETIIGSEKLNPYVFIVCCMLDEMLTVNINKHQY